MKSADPRSIGVGLLDPKKAEKAGDTEAGNMPVILAGLRVRNLMSFHCDSRLHRRQCAPCDDVRAGSTLTLPTGESLSSVLATLPADLTFESPEAAVSVVLEHTMSGLPADAARRRLRHRRPAGRPVARGRRLRDAGIDPESAGSLVDRADVARAIRNIGIG